MRFLGRAAFVRGLRRALPVMVLPAAVFVSPVKAAEQPPIRVGVLHSLTGTMAISERSLVDAILMAVDEINGNGGVLGRKILVVTEDGASDWPTFAAKAEKLIVKDQVVSIFGCWTSACRKAVLPVIQQQDNLLWYPMQYEGGEASPFVVYTGAAPNQQILPAVRWCVEHLRRRRVFLVGSDYIFPRAANRLIRSQLARSNAACVGEEYRPLGDTDFGDIVSRIRASGADAVFNTVNGDSNRGLFFHLNAAGLGPDRVPVISFSIAEDEIPKIGIGMTVGHYAAWTYFQSLDTPDNREFVEAFKARYGPERVTDDPIASAYVQVYLFARAVARAGSTSPRRIREAVRGLEFRAPSGPVRIEPTNQHIWKPAMIGQVQLNGQFRIVWTSIDPIRPDPFPDPSSADVDRPAGETDASAGAGLSGRLAAAMAGLDSEDEALRRRAARELGVLGAAAAPSIDALCRRLADDDWLVRRHVSHALARIGAGAVPALRQALRDPKPAARNGAAAALEEMGGLAAGALPELIEALRDPESEVRSGAARAIGNLGRKGQTAVPALLENLDDRDDDARLQATAALEHVGPGTDPAGDVERLSAALQKGRLARRTALRLIERGARALEDKRDTSAVPSLEAALRAMETAAPGDSNEKTTVLRAVDHLRDIERGDRFERILRFVFKNYWFVLAGMYLLLLAFLWLVGLRFFPFWILRANNWLAPYTDTVRIASFNVPIRSLLLVGLFQYHRHVLDAWVRAHLKLARAHFRGRETVQTHGIYVPLPVDIDGRTEDTVGPARFHPITRQGRWCVLITGEGGVGKTSLACQMALWAMAEDEKERLCEDHPMIPVLLEPDQAAEIETDPAGLRRIILGQLRVLVGAPDDIPDAFLERLLRERRVVVIIDDLPVRPADKDFPVAALIVTSRDDESLGGIPRTRVNPLKLTGGHLSSFMHGYLTRKGKREIFSDATFFGVCERLSTIVQERKTTALFARMYADQLIGADTADGSFDLPKDLPELMLGYLKELNRRRKPEDPTDQEVRDAATIVAWECMKDGYRLSVVRRDVVLSRLIPVLTAELATTEGELARREAVDRAEHLLHYLEARLRLIRTVGVARKLFFVIEPLAEYLASLRLTQQLGSDEPGWRAFLARCDEQSATGAAVKGFLLAVRDSCLAQGRERGVPSWVPEETARRCGMKFETVVAEPVRIGILHSLTGTMSISERSLVDSALLAVGEINAGGGLLGGRRLVPVVEDGASNWPTFARKALKLITEDKTCSIFGCWTSASRKAVLPAVEEHDHLLWYPLQYEGCESSKNVIYTGACPNQQIIPAVNWCLQHLGRRSMFLLGSDYVFPRTANQIIKAHLAAEGAVCTGEEYQSLGNKDFTAIVERIVHSGADVILNTVNGDSNIGLFRALGEAGITHAGLPVISFSIAEDELRSIGTALTAGHYCAWNYFQCIDTPPNRRFVDAFKREYGMDRVTDDPIEAAYLQVHLFAKAVNKAGSTDPRAIREAARGIELEAPGGLVRIDPDNQHTWTAARIGQIQPDGQFRLVWSSDDLLPPEPFPRLLFPDGLPERRPGQPLSRPRVHGH